MPSPALRRLIAILAAAAVIPTAASAFPPAPPDADQTRVRLARLTVKPAGTLAGYSRERFGGDWATTANGCDVRERVLIRDGRGFKRGPGCTITTGRWRSVYDGKILTTGRSVDIDHIVPLAESWRSGANAWTAQRRERFANDLREPQLIAVSAASNRSKGDSPPQEWKPPRRAIWCLYSLVDRRQDDLPPHSHPAGETRAASHAAHLRVSSRAGMRDSTVDDAPSRFRGERSKHAKAALCVQLFGCPLAWRLLRKGGLSGDVMRMPECRRTS